jgi:hypothetical protein
MTQQFSLADQAVAALAAIARMDAEITSESPERHLVWSLKRQAEALLFDVLRRAHELAYLASDIQRAMKEAKDPQP